MLNAITPKNNLILTELPPLKVNLENVLKLAWCKLYDLILCWKIVKDVVFCCINFLVKILLFWMKNFKFYKINFNYKVFVKTMRRPIVLSTVLYVKKAFSRFTSNIRKIT